MAERAATGTANPFGMSGFIHRLSRAEKIAPPATCASFWS